MMTHRDAYFSVVAGKKPRNMPFVPDITDWYNGRHTPTGEARIHGPGCYIPDDDSVKDYDGTIPAQYRKWSLLDFYRNFEWGFHAHIYDWGETKYHNGIEEVVIQGKNEYDVEIRTPQATLSRKYRLAADGSWCPTERYVKSKNDFVLLIAAVASQYFTPKHDYVASILKGVGAQGQVDISLHRSPFGKLVHEYLGFENTVYALMDYPEWIDEYLEIQTEKDLEVVSLACASPARLVYLCDHADETLISPAWYKRFCIPYYQKAVNMLHQHGKIVSTHLDGNFKGIFPMLHETRFDVLDGCTPAPMFNYEIEELAAALPEGMYVFIGVPATLFCQQLPTKELLKYAERIITSFQGRAIINVGDILPPNGDIQQVIELGEYVKSTYQ